MPLPLARSPVITLTTDFGLEDAYVAAMKAALLREVPRAQLIDVTHRIPPEDIVAGAIALERAVAAFDARTVHLAVVDPGVGTQRRVLVAEVREQLIVCPDNGLITWAWHRQGGAGRRVRCHELLWRPERFSATFHGRDIMAPAAGMLASGRAIDELARPIDDPALLDLAPAPPGASHGRIIHIDHFGNATTNVPAENVASGVEVSAGGREIGPVRRTYADVPAGMPLALIGSADLLEIALRNGSAAAALGLKAGSEVALMPSLGPSR